MSNSVQPHRLQHAGFCNLTISHSLLKFRSIESVIQSNHLILCCPFLLLPSIFPKIVSFPMNQLFASNGQRIGASATGTTMNIQDWFSLGLTNLISLQSKGLSRVFSSPQFENISSLELNLLYSPTLTSVHDYWKTIADFVSKVMSVVCTMLAIFPIAFLPRSKHLNFSWLKAPSAVILEPEKIKCVTVSMFSPSFCHEVMGPDAMILVFWMLSFKSVSPLFYPHQESLQFFISYH